MSRWVLPFLAGFIFVAGSSAPAQGQVAQSTQSPAAAVTQQGATQQPAANPSSSQGASKKVWTNEDLSAQDPTGISTVGRGAGNTGRRAAPARPLPAGGRNAKWYQGQIASLQAKIPVLDSQIADLRAAIDGKATGDGKKSVRPYGVRMDDWSRELTELQKRREDTLAQISELEDQARHNGVATDAIP